MLTFSHDFTDSGAFLLASQAGATDSHCQNRLAQFAKDEFDEYVPMKPAEQEPTTVFEKVEIVTRVAARAVTPIAEDADFLQAEEAPRADEIIVSPTPPKEIRHTPSPPSDVEVDKKAERRARNRQSAHLARERKKQYKASLEKQAEELIAKNSELQEKIDRLKAENSRLKKMRLLSPT